MVAAKMPQPGDPALIAFLRSLGATDEQLEEAANRWRLAGLAADLVLAKGATLTARGVASHIGVDVDDVLSLWRLLGVSMADADKPMFTEADQAFTAAAIEAGSGTYVDELLRVLGSSLARVAEATVSLYVQTVEPIFDTPEPDFLAWARDLASSASAALTLGDSMGTVFAHHLRDAIDRQRQAQEGVAERSLSRLAVGFVDLVGFTPLSQRIGPVELLDLIGRFEARAFEVASTHDGRIVKHIGDEIMFVALNASAGCRIAGSLLRGFIGEGIEPRSGLAYGEIISRHATTTGR